MNAMLRLRCPYHDPPADPFLAGLEVIDAGGQEQSEYQIRCNACEATWSGIDGTALTGPLHNDDEGPDS